jgi:hypothetical protein
VDGFGETLEWLIEKKGLKGPEDLAGLLDEIGHPVSERDKGLLEGSQWVDQHLPRQVARGLKLDVEEMGELARTVAYGQAGATRNLFW